MSSTSGIMESFLRFCVPYMVMFALFLISLASFATPLAATIEVPCIIMVIYYWAIYRPTLLPPVLVFMIGFCLDVLSGFPIGVNCFVLLIVRQIVAEQRLFLTGQPFSVIWLGYCIVSAVALILEWILFGLIHFNWTHFVPTGLGIMTGILVFPCVCLILNLSHKVLPLIPDQYSAVK